MDIPLTLRQTQSGLLSKQYSCVELVDSYLARIKKYDSSINSFLTLSEDTAYEQAKRVDKLIEDLGERALAQYPLLGAVIAYKDIFLTKGIRTTAGSKVLENYIPAYSATYVIRAEAAGAIPVGKLNEDAWAHGSSGENSDFGPTKNPWDSSCVPGGSSSGSGAAIAANFSLITSGTDTCGSIRLPANYCFAVGLKPTYGVVSRYGIVAMASSLDSVGMLGRSVDDVERVFNVVSGLDGKDSTLAKKDNKEAKTNYRVGIPKEFFVEGLSEVVKKDVMYAIEQYKQAGVQFVDVDLPHTKYGISVYYIIQPAEVSSNLGRYDGIRFGNGRETFGDEAKRRIMLGTYVLSAGYYDAYYLRAMKVRTIIREEVNKVFENVDALIAPVAPTPPFKLGEKVDDPLSMYLTDIYAATANLSGIPSLAVPTTFTKGGLPLGFQLMGPRFSEATLFNLGRLYHQTVGYKPKVASL